MSNTELRQGSLILYKSRPGRVTQAGSKKIEIALEGGQTVSVRPKDVSLLHPGPIPSLAALSPTPAGEVITAWELLAGGHTTLAELAELTFGSYTPATAWATWQLVADGLYFSGSAEEITAHPPETVAAEQATRAARAAEEAAWNAFLARAQAGRYAAADEAYLQDVVALALGQRDQSRVLRTLGHSENPQNAHALLLATGYWTASFNPYPARAGVPTHEPDLPLPPLPDEPRRDLTHLTALAIDDAGSQDPDDALSIDGDRLWVHIADVAALVWPDSPADLEARARGANLYLPEGTVHMLPPAATHQLALGLAAVSPALSFGLTLSPDGEIAGLEITPSWVHVTRLTYEEAEARLAESPLDQLHALAQQFIARRQANGAIEIDLPEVKVRVDEGQVAVEPLPNLRSRDLVREAMLMTGEAVARYALAHGLLVPFATQDVEDLDASEYDRSPAGMFALRRMMRRSQQRSAPAPHHGLGLDLYTQCTSPLRRYLDLVVHQQLRAHLRAEAGLSEQALMERVGAADAVSGSVRWAERNAINHWTLVYLQQNPDWQGEGIVVDKRGARDVLLLPDLAWETQAYLRADLPLNSRVRLRCTELNLPELDAIFSPAGNFNNPDPTS